MKRMAFAVPGDLATATGGYVSDRRIVGELPKFGWEVHVLDLGATFPRASVAERASAHRQLAALPAGELIVIDGLAFGVMPDSAEALRRTHKLVALVHHPLAFETGLEESDAVQFRESERQALSFVHRIVTTSATTAKLLVEHFAVSPEKISVVVPGTDRVPIVDRSGAGDTANEVVNILAVGSLVPRKGYDVLIAALGQIPDLPWRMIIVGDPTRSPATARALEEQIASLHLADRIALGGVVSAEQLALLYDGADLFVLPSRYEGFGMVYAEAVAHGLPVIGTTAGAIPEAVPPGAGVLVAPDNVSELTLALTRVIGNPAERERLTAGARAAAVRLPTWEDSGRLFAQALEQVA